MNIDKNGYNNGEHRCTTRTSLFFMSKYKTDYKYEFNSVAVKQESNK